MAAAAAESGILGVVGAAGGLAPARDVYRAWAGEASAVTYRLKVDVVKESGPHLVDVVVRQSTRLGLRSTEPCRGIAPLAIPLAQAEFEPIAVATAEVGSVLEM